MTMCQYLKYLSGSKWFAMGSDHMVAEEKRFFEADAGHEQSSPGRMACIATF